MTAKAELLKILEAGIVDRGVFTVRGCREHACKAYNKAEEGGYRAISASLATLLSPDAPHGSEELKTAADLVYNEAAD